MILYNKPPPLKKICDLLEQIHGEVEEAIPFEIPDILVFVDCSFKTSPRNFAGVQVGDPTMMYLCWDLGKQKTDRIRAILYHEFGHILDWIERTYRFDFIHSRDKKKLDSEQLADALAHAVCGVRINYDQDLVQTLKPGIWPRPKGLR